MNSVLYGKVEEPQISLYTLKERCWNHLCLRVNGQGNERERGAEKAPLFRWPALSLARGSDSRINPVWGLRVAMAEAV